MEQLKEYLRDYLLGRMSENHWRGNLSSSAVSTAVAAFALHSIDKRKYRLEVINAAEWLKQNCQENGAWGDSPESPHNMTATLLSYAALNKISITEQKTKDFLTFQFGGITDSHITEGVKAYYGKDLTFSAPILVMCGLSGIVQNWNRVPQLPFELSVVPRRFFRFLGLPIVSYAIPALIAVGILRHKKAQKGIIYRLRELMIAPSLKVLTKLQPSHGGFLDAAPLTGFVAMCMSEAGYANHIVTQKCADFLASHIREDGSWPIDTDLAGWVTSLSVKALKGDVPGREATLSFIKSNAFTFTHPFTDAAPGGWGWSDIEGAVPDADDTAGALIALHYLDNTILHDEVVGGVEWLLKLQNSDGGIPTFCKGWGKLPFDRSSADITAHSIAAISLWIEKLDDMPKYKKAVKHMVRWLSKAQNSDGSWTPLWFGDQDNPIEQSPVYGTAVAIENLSIASLKGTEDMIDKGVIFLLSAQNEDGGWGGAKDIKSKVTITAKAVSAICAAKRADSRAIENATNYLLKSYKNGTILNAEPIGLYFARLWYSEQLYNATFTLSALNNLK